MWHQIFRAWLDAGPRFEVPFMALVFLLDGVTGISRRLAVLFKLEKRGDAILIPAMIAILIAFWQAWAYVWPPHLWQMHASNAVWAIRDRALHWVDISDWVWDTAIFSGVAICPFLARRNGRSFAQWTALGYLGNVGAIAWLLLVPRDEKVAAASSLPTP